MGGNTKLILPAKHLSIERSIIGIGAEILDVIETPKTISEAWIQIKDNRKYSGFPITFDWFVMSVSWLYAISAVELVGGLLQRRQS